MSVDRLVEQARELLNPNVKRGPEFRWAPKAAELLAGLADAVEQLQAERAALLENLRARDHRAHRDLLEGGE